MDVSNVEVLLIFFGMMLVTYIPRALPLTILSKISLHPFILQILYYIPIAILGALLFPSVLMNDGNIDISLSNYKLIAAILTSVVAFSFKKLFLTIISGVIFMFLLVNFF